MIDITHIQEVEIVYKNNVPKSQRQKITSSSTAADIFRSTMAEHIEYNEGFYILLLNNSNDVLGISKISEGGPTGCTVDIVMILQRAILAHSKAIILAHNHPSGQLTPSQVDKNITKKIKTASELLDIRTLDHLIITNESYLSFADTGIL